MATKKLPAKQKTKQLTFDYLKSNYFRVIHADGAVGGVTPSGNIQVNFWSQRNPIPQQVVHAMSESGLGVELSRTQRAAIVRELEAGVVFDVTTAISIRDWLSRHIENAKLVLEKPEAVQ